MLLSVLAFDGFRYFTCLCFGCYFAFVLVWWVVAGCCRVL